MIVVVEEVVVVVVVVLQQEVEVLLKPTGTFLDSSGSGPVLGKGEMLLMLWTFLWLWDGHVQKTQILTDHSGRRVRYVFMYVLRGWFKWGFDMTVKTTIIKLLKST